MKKIIPLVLFVLIVGFVAFFFLNNSMAMTTLITQDAALIAKTYNKGVKGVSQHEDFYYETVTKSYSVGNVTTGRKTKVSIKRDGEVVTKILAIIEETDYHLEVYYTLLESGAKAYVTKTPKGSNPVVEYHVYNNITPDQVLDELAEAKPVMFALNGVEDMTTLQRLTNYVEQDAEQFKGKVKSKFSFSPLGAQYEYTVSQTQSYLAAVDVIGKLHSVTYKEGTAESYITVETSFKKYDSAVSIYWKNEENFRDIEEESYTEEPADPGEDPTTPGQGPEEPGEGTEPENPGEGTEPEEDDVVQDPEGGSEGDSE